MGIFYTAAVPDGISLMCEGISEEARAFANFIKKNDRVGGFTEMGAGM